MLEVRAVSCTLILTLVMALASPHLLGVERAWAVKTNDVRNCVTNTAVVRAGDRPYNLAYDSKNDRVYVTNNLPAGSVSIIDACTLKVINTIPVGNDPSGVAYDSGNNRVYVTNNEDNSVSVIDAATLKIIDTISFSYPDQGSNPDRVAYDPVNNRLYVTTVSNGKLNVIDASTLKITDTISLVGTNPAGIAYDSVNNRVYVASVNSVPNVSVIDAS